MDKPTPIREELILVAILHLKEGILLEKTRNGKLQIPGNKFYKNSYAKNVHGEVTKEIECITDALNNKISFRTQNQEKINAVITTAFGIYDFKKKRRRIKAFYASITADTVNLSKESNFEFIPADKKIITQSHQILSDDKNILLDYLKRQKSIKQNNFYVIPVKAVA